MKSVLLKLVLGISLVTAQVPGRYESANFISLKGTNLKEEALGKLSHKDSLHMHDEANEHFHS